MALNQITINFTPCSPAEGYRVFYREVGDVSFIEHPDTFTSSPIVFQVIGPDEQPYEGYIQSDCGGGLFGPQVPWETVLCPPPEGCCDPVIIDADAETIIPDGSESGSESVEGEFLRLVFNTNMSGESLSDWNTFFGFTFDNVVYSGSGTIVDLYLSSPLIIQDSLFEFNTTILRVLDFSNLVIGVESSAFRLCDALIEVDLPGCETIAGVSFWNCTALTDVNLPLLTIISGQAFAGCSSLINLNCPLIETIEASGLDFCISITAINYPNCTSIESAGLRSMHNLVSLSLPNLISLGIEGLRQCNSLAVINLPSCTTIGDRAFRFATTMTTLTLPVCANLGATTGDDQVFQNVSGENIVLTIPTALATDGDVVYLQANNSVTLILV